MNSLNLSLSYIMPDQAQKHVPVNESLRMLDDLLHASVEQTDAQSPPTTPRDGQRYLLGANPNGAWAGHAHQLVSRQDAAWMFYVPQPGWRIWDKATSRLLVYTGTAWQPVVPAAGAGFLHMDEHTHRMSAGATNSIASAIAANSLVLGVTGRVTQAIGGATAWSLGVARAPTRYGQALKVAAASTHVIQAMHFYGAVTPIVLRATSGTFDGTGTLRLRIYRMAFAPPVA